MLAVLRTLTLMLSENREPLKSSEQERSDLTCIFKRHLWLLKQPARREGCGREMSEEALSRQVL